MREHSNYSRDQLLHGVTMRDHHMLDAIYDESFPSVRQMIYMNGGSEQDARDVFQEAMVVLYRKIGTPDFTLTGSVKTFLYAVSRNIWLKELRGRKYLAKDDLVDTLEVENGEDYEFSLMQHERLTLYRKKFEELGPDCKRILKMFLNLIPLREITRSMGYKSDQYTKNRRHHCKAWLIRIIRDSKEYKELHYEQTEAN